MSVLRLQFANNASSTLLYALAADATEATVQGADASLFPTPTRVNEAFRVVIEDRRTAQREVVGVTARSGALLTLERGLEGTTPQAFAVGAVVSNRITAGTLSDLFELIAEYGTLYLGPSAVAPTVNHTGDALVIGNLWYDTGSEILWVWTGSEWTRVYDAWLPLSGGTMASGATITFSTGTPGQVVIDGTAAANAVVQNVHLTAVTLGSVSGGTVTGALLVGPTITDPEVSDGVFADPVITDPTVSDGTFTSPSITTPTITDPTVTTGSFTNPTVTTGSFTNPTVTTGSFTSPSITTPTITNPTVTTGSFTSPSITTPTITNPTVTTGSFTNPTVTTPTLNGTVTMADGAKILFADDTPDTVVLDGTNAANAFIDNMTVDGGTF